MLNLLHFRCLCFWVMLLPCAAFAQNSIFQSIEQYKAQGGRFERSLFFRVSDRVAERSVLAIAPRAQMLDLNAGAVQQIKTTHPEALTFALPFEGDTMMVEAVQVQITTPTCHFYTQSKTLDPAAYTPALHYRGIIAGDPNSLVAFSITTSGEVMGLVADAHHGNMTLGKMDSPDNEMAYIFYPDAELKKHLLFTCATTDEGHSAPVAGGANERGNATVGCVRMAWEGDYALFLEKGGAQGAFDWLTGLFNQVAILYANEQINIQLSQVIVWTVQDAFNNDTPFSFIFALPNFIVFRRSFDGDLAHLISLQRNSLGGIAASIGGLCDKRMAYAHSVVQNNYQQVPTYSWTTLVVAHELGHNLGSQHTHWCGWPGGAIDNCIRPQNSSCQPGPSPSGGGTIMSYCHLQPVGINFSKGFGPLPGNAIRNHVRDAPCLSSDCSASTICAMPKDFTFKTNGDSTVLNWTSQASTHRVYWRILGDSTWNIIDAAQSSYILKGLAKNRLYEAQVQAVCGVNSSVLSPVLVFLFASCDAPTSDQFKAEPFFSNSGVGANFQTTAQAMRYIWEYRVQGATSWQSMATGSKEEIVLLLPDTLYEYRLQLSCLSFAPLNSSWSEIKTVRTPKACNMPTSLTATNITFDGAQLNCNAPAGQEFYWQYAPANPADAVWIDLPDSNKNNVMLRSLTSGTQYKFRAAVLCANGQRSNWSPESTFTTTTPCASVSAQDVELISVRQNSATLRYTKPGILTYRWGYSKDNAIFPLLESTSPEVTISGLLPDLRYDIYLSVQCTDGFWSFWVPVASFLTPTMYDNPCEAYQLPVSDTCLTLNNTFATPAQDTTISTGGCNGENAKDLWLQLNMPVNGNILLRIQSQTLSTPIVALYSGSCENPTYLTCDASNQHDIGIGHSGWLGVRIWGTNGAGGTFKVCKSTLPTGMVPKTMIGNTLRRSPEGLLINPVPATDHITIQASVGETPVEAFLSVISLNGQVMWQRSFMAVGDYQEMISLQHWQPGVYEVRLQTDQRIWRSKFVRFAADR